MKPKRTAMKQKISARSTKNRFLATLFLIAPIGFGGCGFLQQESPNAESESVTLERNRISPADTEPQPEKPTVTKPARDVAVGDMGLGSVPVDERAKRAPAGRPMLQRDQQVKLSIRPPENSKKGPQIETKAPGITSSGEQELVKTAIVAPTTNLDTEKPSPTNPRTRRQVKPHRTPGRIADAETTEHSRPESHRVNEHRVAGLNSGQQTNTDLPEGESVVDLLEEDYEGTLALIYESGEEKWSEGNRMMREVTEAVMEDASLEEQLAWVESLPDGAMKGSAAGRIIEQWGGENALTSLHWALSMEDEGARGSALSAAFAKWGVGVGGGHPELGAEMIDNLANERDRDFALNGYASGLVGTDPELALEVANSIAMPGLRDAAVSRLTEQISRMKQERGE
jgi:hypothetical protein